MRVATDGGVLPIGPLMMGECPHRRTPPPIPSGALPHPYCPAPSLMPCVTSCPVSVSGPFGRWLLLFRSPLLRCLSGSLYVCVSLTCFQPTADAEGPYVDSGHLVAPTSAPEVRSHLFYCPTFFVDSATAA